MKTRPGIDSDRDAIVAQLAQLDSSDPADPAKSPEPPSTVRELKAELDTLIGELREPAGPEPVADETGLRRAQELVRLIGLEPESKARDQRLELGRIGPYELLEKLGEGGMGAVYKALHSSLEKIVALKVLPRERLHPQAISRFKREMKAVGKLDHPNIVRATDAGEADGDHFLVMEYVDGADLSELLRRVGPLAPADACELVRQAANGLQHAHQRRMVHRDIKPNNIMLSWGDEHDPAVKILDMGLALLSEPKASAHGDLTTTGQMMGTVEYMSPEQGLDTHNVDIRSDIYSLGATLYKLLCGKAPFTGARYNTPGKILVALATEKTASIGTKRADLPIGLVSLVDKMLAKDAAERYATPAEVAQALAPFAVGADLRRLANAARHGVPANDAADKSGIPTKEHLSSPITGTVSEVKVAWEGATREGEAPAEPLLPAVCGSAGASPSHTSPSPSPSASRRRVSVVAAVGLLLVGLGGILFGGQIIRIITNQGQIVIDSDGAGIEVVIKDGQGKVLDTETKREFTFTAGEYNLEVTVKDSAGEQRFVTDHFVLTRNGRKTVDARWERAKPMPTADPDRRVAEWVLRVGGSLAIEFDGKLHEPLTRVAELPAGPFKVWNINLHPPAKVDDVALENLRGLTDLASTLQLADQPITDGGVERLISMPGLANLTTLNLCGTRITDVAVAHLKRFKKLSYLQLARTQVTDEGLKHIKDMPLVNQLIIGNTAISDAGLAHLRGLKLNVLHIYECRGITGPGLEHLRNMTSLTFLHLQHTPVGADAVEKFAAALPGCKIVWDGGTIEPSSVLAPVPLTAEQRRALEWLLTHHGNATCRYENQYLWNLTPSTLPKGPAEFVNLTLEQFSLTEESHRQLLALPNFGQGFGVGHSPNIRDAELERLLELPNLRGITEVSLYDVGITDASLPLLKRFRLNLLVLGAIPITDRGFQEVAELPLTRLELLECPQLTGKSFQSIGKIRTLTELHLQKFAFKDAELAFLTSLDRLKALSAMNTPITDAGLEHLAKLPAIEVLSLTRTKVTEAGVKKLWAALPGCKMEWDGGVIEPSVATNPDRRAAEWVLSIGGSIRIQENAQEREIKAVGDLPRTAFELTSVNLEGNPKVTDAGLANFKDCKNVTVLWLNGTKVSDDGLAHFKDCKNLTLLWLDGTQVSDVGLAHFHGCRKIRDLCLANTHVTDVGLAYFRECKNLGQFYLNNTRVTDGGLSNFRECKEIVYLYLGDTKVTDAGLANFRDCRNLMRLMLGKTQVTDVGLAYFRDCHDLSILELGDTMVTDLGLAHLKDCNNLSDLRLRGTKVGDAGLAYIKDYKNLTTLGLYGTKVSDAGLNLLTGMQQLTYLSLQKTTVTQSGVKKLSAALPGCRIEWDGGVIEPTVAADPDHRAAEWVLSIGGTISIKENEKEREIKTAGDLPSGAIQLTFVDLHDNPEVSDAGLVHLKDCTNVTKLSLHGAKVGDTGLAHFKDYRKLTFLRLSSTVVTDTGLVHFKDCKNLVYLCLDATQVSDAGLAHFKSCKNLVTLHLQNTRVSDTGLALFKDCVNLEVLGLSGTKVMDAGLDNFKDCKHLTYLDLGHSNVNDVGLAHFKDYKNITYLNLAGTQVRDVGLAHFKDHKNLTYLNLAGTQVSDAGLAHFRDCKNITQFDLVDTQVSDAGLADLASLPRLTELYLGNTRISLHGHEQLKTALPKCVIAWSETNRSVAESVLAVGGTVEIGLPGQPESRPVKVAADLPSDYFQVRRVSLAGVGRPRDDAVFIGLRLLSFPKFDGLESLDLSGIPSLNYEGFLDSIHGLRELNLAKTGVNMATLPKLPALQRLVLDGNSIGEPGLAALDKQTALTELSLANAGLNDQSLAKLPKLPALKRLVLDGNDIRGTGLQALTVQPELIDLSLGCPTLTDLLAKNLAELKQLKRLSLAGSSLSDAGIKQLASLKNLESLDLRRTKATAAGNAELQKALPTCKIEWDGIKDR